MRADLPRSTRFALAVALVGAFVAVLLGWNAGVDWRSPWQPSQRIAMRGADFRVVMGGGAQDEDRLRIGAVGEERTALQSSARSDIEAAAYPLLRYRFEHFPRTLELSLVFRRADQPDDVHVVSLPWPSGLAAFDLRSIPEWRGRIVEIGFAEYPTPQLVPPTQAFRPFTLVEAQLWSASWQGSFAALATDWFGNWPWSQRSVHALGRDTDTPRAGSLVLAIALGAAFVPLLAAVLFGLRGRRLVVFAACVVGAGWLLLDLHWQHGLAWRRDATRTLYGGLDWTQRAQRVADADVLDAARRTAERLRDEPATTRVLVQGGSGYTTLRLIYHLLPMNAGVLFQEGEGGLAALPAGCIIVVYDAPDWHYDGTAHALVAPGIRLPGEVISDDHGLLLLRYRGKS